MWIESQDKKHLVNANRFHKKIVEHVKHKRVVDCGLVEIEDIYTYTYQILDENGLVLGEYSTEEQWNDVWMSLKKRMLSGIEYLYIMPENKKEVSEDEENK